MRATARDVLRHPSWLGGWWQDWPCRRRAFWRALLLEEGQGWLRWGTAQRTEYDYIDEGLAAPYTMTSAPPLRRLAMYLRGWATRPFLVWPGHRFRDTGGWLRLSWAETRLTLADFADLKDPDRKDLWR